LQQLEAKLCGTKAAAAMAGTCVDFAIKWRLTPSGFAEIVRTIWNGLYDQKRSSWAFTGLQQPCRIFHSTSVKIQISVGKNNERKFEL
jgi:hypothetical protein